ncbi:unnamed protein product [Cuscuta epithymum]|uniref:BTB domain-containing protein n=1 Tax=Cuscuta epithymum TaxID=186058 RepID=A0AAV0F586_9ASTE|nr:unnamed protein product [Cuscuta epithymum]
MENGNNLSSPLSFASSSSLSNGSSGDGPHEATSNPELLNLSTGLERLLIDTEFEYYTDAEIIVEGVSVGVNRCILAARSHVFHEIFKTAKAEGKASKFVLTELLPRPGWVGYEAFKVFLSYLYTGKLKPPPPEVSQCVDHSCVHFACRPAIIYAVELMYASVTFQMKDLVMVLQRGLINFLDKAQAEDLIPILMVAYHCSLSQLLEHSIQRVTLSDLDNFSLEKELPVEIFNIVKAHRLKSEQHTTQVESLKGKGIRRILKALDSDDIELVKLLLAESSTVRLDDAYALHYAVAYCNSKVVIEILGLRLANLNLFNARGYTALHVAARRKDPSIIVGLLKNGASVWGASQYGQDVVAICRRVTRAKDYYELVKQGQETNKDRLCIDVLEREMRQNPMAGTMSMSSSTMADELLMGLCLLENRVALARQLFPREARLAMEQAHVDSTFEFAGLSSTNGSFGNLRGVDLNELPSDQVRRLEERHEALQRTVATGRRFFPNCSEVLDRFLEDDVLDSLMLESGTPEEQSFKKIRYIELKEEVKKAFVKDKAHWSALSSPPSSASLTPVKCSATPRVRKRIKR